MASPAVGKIDVGGVIRKVWSIYVDQAPVLMPAAAVVFVFTGVISVVLLQSSSGLAFLALLIGLIATTLFTGMVVELVADVQDGRRDATPGQLLRAATPVLGPLILIAIVVGVLTLIGFVLVIVPGLIVLTIWSVAAPVVVLERPPGLKAMRRSRELVRRQRLVGVRGDPRARSRGRDRRRLDRDRGGIGRHGRRHRRPGDTRRADRAAVGAGERRSCTSNCAAPMARPRSLRPCRSRRPPIRIRSAGPSAGGER